MKKAPVSVFENAIIWPFSISVVKLSLIKATKKHFALDLIVISENNDQSECHTIKSCITFSILVRKSRDRKKGRNELRKFQECCGMNKQIYTSTTSGKHLYEHYSLYEMN
ncbi:hypothetical protein T01_5101 [Trichinella spiralis]|uniref:Uncharacterized protein n=1 Tax=Trichinella spiralis TaxID=6334 RepID=A0A0V1ARA7_TRISP|nr:hypothetical protein T01_5101 [Trichinella spiralis]